MVLKFGSEPNEVFFMEATSNQGVSLKRFSGMKFAIGNFYKKVVPRIRQAIKHTLDAMWLKLQHQ